jgi:hypothetical protein
MTVVQLIEGRWCKFPRERAFVLVMCDEEGNLDGLKNTIKTDRMLNEAWKSSFAAQYGVYVN